MKRYNFFVSQMLASTGSLAGASHVQYGRPSHWQPHVDIYERTDSIIVVVELPGVNREKISVTINDGMLRISGTRPKSIPSGTIHVHQMEVPCGRFERTLRLPPLAHPEEVEAAYSEGYLTITIPKADALPKK
jgi:HSP20 family protein